MSETWQASRTSIRKLKRSLKEADDDTRYNAAFWAIGLMMMAIAIASQFGWLGLLFIVGFLIWAAGNHGLK